MGTKSSAEIEARVERVARRGYEEAYPGGKPWEELPAEERARHCEITRFVLIGEGEIEL